MPAELFNVNDATSTRDSGLGARRTATLLNRFIDSHRELKSYKWVLISNDSTNAQPHHVGMVAQLMSMATIYH